MIQFTNIHKRFQSNVVLDGISFDVERGDVIAISGHSGTGKSTLLRCINLPERPEEGTAQFEDFKIDYANYTPKEMHILRQKTGMVFQSFHLFQRKTALENVMEGLTVVQKMPEKEARELAIHQLERVKMADRLNYYPRHLSGGQQQRVAIARAIAMKPELLLLDEPTSALDPELVGEVLDTIRDIAKDGNTMLLVSHEMNFVRHVANKVLFMEEGKVIESGTPEKIFTNPDNERTKQFLRKNTQAFYR